MGQAGVLPASTAEALLGGELPPALEPAKSSNDEPVEAELIYPDEVY